MLYTSNDEETLPIAFDAATALAICELANNVPMLACGGLSSPFHDSILGLEQDKAVYVKESGCISSSFTV